jgi:hypothetical protein
MSYRMDPFDTFVALRCVSSVEGLPPTANLTECLNLRDRKMT